MQHAPSANAVDRPAAIFVRTAPETAVSNLRTSERILFAYFIYAAFMACIHPVSMAARWVFFAIPALLLAGAVTESRHGRVWSSIVRDWLVLALIPVAYWQMDAFPSAPLRVQAVWVKWDHTLLQTLGLQGLIEMFGPAIPSVLEFTYLCLYAIPPLCMAVLYLNGKRSRANRFLTTLFLGTMTAYALLPFFPTRDPRIAFPGQDLPHYSSIWRSINVFLLNNLDIRTSVFPSGHVAVAFSSAFGILRAMPDKPWAGRVFLVIAALVFTATIYCRYHYAVDGLCSIAIAFLAWRVEGLVNGAE